MASSRRSALAWRRARDRTHSSEVAAINEERAVAGAGEAVEDGCPLDAASDNGNIKRREVAVPEQLAEGQ